jgi:hypothetical protein
VSDEPLSQSETGGDDVVEEVDQPVVRMRSHVRDYAQQNARPVSFAELSSAGNAININFMKQPATGNGSPSPSTKKRPQVTRKTPTQQQHPVPSSPTSPDTVSNMAAEITSLRMQLEEKKRRIEAEKRKMEASLAVRKQKVGQEAFMHALHKVRHELHSPFVSLFLSLS